MSSLHQPLLDLQDLDLRLADAQKRWVAFEPKLAEVEAPVTMLTRDTEATRTQLETAEKESRRLERGAEEKRDRLRKYEERLERVRNVREESAARTEIDLVRRAAEADEEEAVGLMDQSRKISLRLSEMEKRLESARAEVEPRRNELLDARREVEAEIEALKAQREAQASDIPAPVLRLYERVRSGRPRAVVPMTASGACGNCFGTLPIQEQNRVRQGDAIQTCETCGVILFAPSD